MKESKDAYKDSGHKEDVKERVQAGLKSLGINSQAPDKKESDEMEKRRALFKKIKEDEAKMDK